MSSARSPEEIITLEIRDYIGIITIDNQPKLNALSSREFTRIIDLLEELAKNPDTYVTLITGKGRFFSAGADVSTVKDGGDELTAREYWARFFAANAFHQTQVWYSHPKILVAALNGPVVGITASYISHCDFIYAAPHTYLLTPFTSLGLSAEGGASRAFVAKMGSGLANEALLMSKRIPVQDLVSVRFVNRVFHEGGGDPESGKGFNSDLFLDAVLKEVDNRLGKHLVGASLLKIKALLRKAESEQLDRALVGEVSTGLQGFLDKIPQEEFRKIVSGEKRHKL